MNALFPEEFLAALMPLRLRVGKIRALATSGEHVAAHRGAGLEFREYQAYSPGDDLRRVDWNVYRRSGHLFLRRQDHMRTVPVYILTDASQSMFFENPPRWRAGAQMAAAIAAAALREHDSVDIVPFGATVSAGIHRVTGRARLARVLERLTAQGPLGQTDFAASCAALAPLARRSGVVFVISDFFDPRGGRAVVDALATLRHRLVLIRLQRPSDAAPAITDDAELRDCETGTVRLVGDAAALRATYRAAYAEFDRVINEFVAGYGGREYRVDPEQPLIAQLGRLFPGGVITA